MYARARSLAPVLFVLNTLHTYYLWQRFIYSHREPSLVRTAALLFRFRPRKNLFIIYRRHSRAHTALARNIERGAQKLRGAEREREKRNTKWSNGKRRTLCVKSKSVIDFNSTDKQHTNYTVVYTAAAVRVIELWPRIHHSAEIPELSLSRDTRLTRENHLCAD